MGMLMWLRVLMGIKPPYTQMFKKNDELEKLWNCKQISRRFFDLLMPELGEPYLGILVTLA